MLNPQHLERLVLEGVAKGSRDSWVPFSIGALKNRLIKSDRQATDVSSTEIVETVIALEAGNLISIQKRQGSPPIVVPYDRASCQGESYISAFFYRGSFELRLAHDGRKKLAQIEVMVADTLGEPDEFDDRLPLYRRKMFDADVRKFAADAMNHSQPLGLLIIDPDRFKEVNDRYGHPVGDRVLLALSNLVAARVNAKGKAYRYGGDEIAVLLRNYTAEEATVLAEIVRKDIESAHLSDEKVRMTASFGVAALPEHATDAQGLLDRADKALYQAKALGRNLVRISGEPDSVPQPPRKVERRQPSPNALTDDEREEIRADHFSGVSPRCPKDGTLLRLVLDALEVGSTTPHFLFSCPQCGLFLDLPPQA